MLMMYTPSTKNTLHHAKGRTHNTQFKALKAHSRMAYSRMAYSQSAHDAGCMLDSGDDDPPGVRHLMQDGGSRWMIVVTMVVRNHSTYWFRWLRARMCCAYLLAKWAQNSTICSVVLDCCRLCHSGTVAMVMELTSRCSACLGSSTARQ